MNDTYRLQILHTGTVFGDSESALNYVANNLTGKVLLGEPAIAFYGDEKDPNVILCIGSVEGKKVYTIDITAMQAEIDKLEESSSQDADALTDAINTINGILTATGLTKTELKEGVEVTPDIDVKDPIIGDAESIAEAIALLSEYAQNLASDSQIIVEDSDSVHLEKEDGVLKAYVRISELGDTSVATNDDNILGTFSDGLYAVASLDYDEEKKTLTFVTSGYDENGDFKRDANSKTINLGGHTLYEEYNKGHNVEVAVDNDNMTISADVKISDGDNNILESKNDGLMVKGNASNIKYHNTTVREAINDLYDKVTDAAKKAEYNDSDTVKFTSTTDSNDELNVSADVKLSSDESIVVSNGGLSVDLSISVNSNNKLVVKLGNTTKRIDLPGVDVIDLIEFKDGYLIIYYNGNTKQVEIPLEGLIAHYVFENDNDHYVHLDADMDSDGIYHVYASVKLRSSDNLIAHNSSGELFVSKEEIESIVSGISDDIIERVGALEAKVSDLETANVEIVKDIEQLQKDVDTNATNISANSDAINAIQAQMGVDETSLKAIQAQVETNTINIATNASDITAIQNQMVADETAFSALSEQVKTNESNIQTNADAISALQDEVKEVESEIKLDEQTIENLTNEVKGVEDTVSEVQADVATNTSNITTLTTRTDTLDEEIATLNADADTVGSVQHTVKVAKDILEEELSTETTRATTAEDNLQDQIDSLSAQLSGDEESILADAKAYTDAETTRATAAEEALQGSVDAVNGEIDVINTELEKKIESVAVRKIDNLHYEVMVDGQPVSEVIEVLDAVLLASASYDPSTQILTLVFDTNNGQQTITVDLSSLVDVYEAGDGLQLNGATFNVHINSQSESYLTVDSDGLCLNGIDDALGRKADVTYVDEQVEELNERISTLEGTEYTAGSGIDITDLTISAKLNEDANTEGYLKLGLDGLYVSGVDSAIAEAVAEESARAQEAESALQDAIDEVAGELCEAGDGLRKVDVEGGHKFNVHINENSQSYLTVSEDGLNLSGVAGVDELSEVQDGVNTNASAIEKLEDSFDAYKFHTADTSTVELTMKEAEAEGSNRELSAKVVISSQANNNIIDNGGLYSISEFNYNAATNVMTFTNCNGVHEFTVNTDYTLVEGGYYDSTNHAVVLIVKDSSGETHEISIPISDLIYDIDVDNDVNDPVKLKITTDATTGAKVISATLEIANLDSNLIETNNGALYASNLAQDMYCINTEGTQETIQQAISGFYSDISTINNTLENLGDNIGSTDDELKELTEKVNSNTTDIAVLQGQVATLTSQVSDLQQQFGVVQQTVADMQECLGDICSSENTVQERLTVIEETIAQLVDFGAY